MTFIEDEVDAKRLSEVISVFFNYELGFIIKKLGLKDMLSLNYRLEKNRFEFKNIQPYTIRKCLEESGFGFVNLGKFLSLRTDIIPVIYAQEFSNIKDIAEEIPFANILKILEAELKQPIRTIFSDIHEKSFASDSTSQKHEAVLRTGESVVIKIQKPNLEEVFKKDVKIMYYLAKLITKVYNLKILDTKKVVQEFEDWLKKQLDFEEELKNYERFYHNSIDDVNLKIPKVYWEYTTNKVLILEKIEGKDINEVLKFKDCDKNQASKKITDALLKQILINYFFNPSLNVENIFVADNKVIFAEAKIAGLLEDRVKRSTQRILAGIIERNPNMILDCLVSLNTNNNVVDRVELVKEIGKELNYNVDVRNIDIIAIMHKVLLLSKKHELKLPLDFILVIKSLLNLRDLNEKLGSKISLADEIVKTFGEKEDRRKFMKEFKDMIKGDKYIFEVFVEKHRKNFDKIVLGIITFFFAAAGFLSLDTNGFKILGLNILSFLFFLVAIVIIGILLYKIIDEKRVMK